MNEQNEKKLRNAVLQVFLESNLTRREFAEKISVDEKTIDSWLADIDKSSHKNPSLINARKIETEFGLSQGAICNLVDNECVFSDSDSAKEKLGDVLLRHELFGNALLVYDAILCLPEFFSAEDILGSCSALKKKKVETVLSRLVDMHYIKAITDKNTISYSLDTIL